MRPTSMPPYICPAAWIAVAVLFHSVCLSSTTFRLHRRFRMKNMWWDDYCAFAAFLLSLSFFTTMFSGAGPYEIPGHLQRKIVLFWMTGVIPPLIVWIARISICLSIARMDIQHTAIRVRPWTYVLITAFALVGGAMFFQKIWVCTGSDSWHYTKSVQCYVGQTVGYISLTGDLLADTLLTAISFKLLWKVHLRRSQKRLLSWLFAANILSSLAGIAYGVVTIDANNLGPDRPQLIGLVVHIKTSVTLTVSNLIVVVTYFYARFWRSSSSDNESDSDSAPNTRRHSHLPNGRTTKQSTAGRPNTVLILTELDSDGSVISWNPQARRGITTTLTYASTDLRSLPRHPPRALGRNSCPQHGTTSAPSYSDGDWDMHGLARSVSEPSSYSRSYGEISGGR